MFKKYLSGVFVFLSFVFFVPSSKAITDLGGFTITNFKVDIFVKKDATLEVKEEITADFSEKRHGIFRKIPVKYKDDQGFGYNMKLEVLAVENEKGVKIEYQESTSNGDKILKIGDSNLEVIGIQKYIIKYRIERGLRYFDDHDEIYWNPIGTGWPTIIYNASSTIRFENGVDFVSGSGLCFTGIFGSTKKNCRVEELSLGSVKFYVSKFLDKNEGLTVVINLPKGAVREPTDKEYFLLFLRDNWGFGLPIFVFVIMFIIWWKKGRDINLNKTVIAQYQAPDNLTPGEVGYLFKEKYSAKFVAADIINLAVKGYVDIFEVESVRSLLPNKFMKYFKLVRLVVFAVVSFLAIKIAISLFSPNFSVDTVFNLIIFSFFLFIFTVKFKSKTNFKNYELKNKKILKEINNLTEHEKELFKGLFGSSQLKRIKLSSKKSFYENVSSAKTKLVERLKSLGYFKQEIYNKAGVYLLVFIIGGILILIISGIVGRVDLFLGAVLSIPIEIIFVSIMSKKTLKGAEAYWKIKGYKYYIDVAEKHRAEFNTKENIFEKTLPYAMVFGNTNKWAKAFEGLLTESPDWYNSNSINSFDSTIFASSMASGFVSAAQSASASPSSSGSGGGGSSGGGGGGGGGGSW